MSDSNNASSPTQYRTVGILLAIGSGLLIGTSFVFKKKGLLKSQAGHAAGEGVAYLKSPMWWTGMTMMICGELCNFGAYAFVEAIVVTPLGALSVVISAILSHLILKEKLTLFGWIGCTQCILGAIIIALNGPEEQSVSTITAFKKLFLAPGFLSYGSVCIAVSLGIIFFVAPKYGSRSMIWYILVCSLIGGISVSCTQGLGACILTTIRGQNQFKNWFIYFLLVFVVCTLLTEIYYLNVALALFNTAMVTPTYYVLFTFFTLVTSIILYQGLKASASAIITITLAFLVICSGIFILQMSKIDPRRLSKLDRKTTMLLQAAREEVKPPGEEGGEGEMDEEKLLEATEEPGMDALAGRFSGLGGTVVRARRRATLKAQGWRGRKREIGSVDTTRSAPAPRLARPSTQSGQSGQSSDGMDSVRARQLHALWREEWDEKRGKENGDGSETVQTYMEPVSMDEDGKMTRWGGVDNSIDGLPFPGDHDLGGGGEKPRMLSSNDQLVSSPAGTPTSESKKQVHQVHRNNSNKPPSVHFDDRPQSSRSGRSNDTAMRPGTGGSGGGSRVRPDMHMPLPPSLPSPPAPALTSTPTPEGRTRFFPSTSTSKLSLRLPTPSIQIPGFGFLSRGHSYAEQPSSIVENSQEEKDKDKDKDKEKDKDKDKEGKK